VPTTVVERYGSLSATGLAREATFGTPVVPTGFVPMTGNELQLDVGLFSPKVMFGQRDLNTFALYGQYKLAGALSAPLFPSNGAMLIAGAIGPDAQAGFGVTGTVGTGSTTLSGGSSAGATTITVTSAAGLSQNQVIQIDVNNTSTPTTAECRKITNITTNTLTLDSALTYAHLTGVAVIGVVAPYTHSVQQANSLSSFTVEKNLGGFDSLQFAGARINKFNISTQNGDTEATFSADLVAKSSAVLDSPSAISIVNESPFVFAEATVSLFSQSVLQATDFSMDVENGLVSTYTFNASHNLQFLTPVTRRVSGKIDVVFTSLDDATWGYYTQMVNGTSGALTFTLAHPASGGSIIFTLPKVYIKLATDAVKMEDVIMTSLSYEAFLNLSTLQTISATVIDSNYLTL